MLRSSRSKLLAFLGGLGLLVGAAGTAQSGEFPLTHAFDGSVAEFGTVTVIEDGGDLHFQISINPDVLGSKADLHTLYFNLGGHSGYSGVTDDMVFTKYEVVMDPKVAGGAGSSFDMAIHFGNGGGKKGNGTLQNASFTLSADDSLSVEGDMLVESSTRSGVSVHVAAHIQSTSFYGSDGGMTVGGMYKAADVVPLPVPVPPESDPVPDGEDGGFICLDLDCSF